jgi:hypothetical protein
MHQTKYSHYQTKYIGKQVGLRTDQHPCIARFKAVKLDTSEGRERRFRTFDKKVLRRTFGKMRNEVEEGKET